MDNKPNRDKKIEDVFFTSRKKVIHLREKIWRIELKNRDIKQFFKKIQPHFVLVSVIFVFIISFIGYLLVTKAEIANFYPTSCLGGWQNPQNAQNKPELGENASPEEFNETNSTVLENFISQIFCGNFQGEAPESPQPQKVIVKFSWLVKLETGDKRQATSTLIEIIFPEATSTEIDMPYSTSSQEETLIIAPEETTSTPTIQEETAPAEEATSSPSAFFWRPIRNFISNGTSKIINFAFAEETSTQENPIAQESLTPLITIEGDDTASSLPESSSTLEILETTETNILTPDVDILPIEEMTESTSTNESLIPNIPIATATNATSAEEIATTTLITPPTPEPFLEILYTLDGANWQGLGKVNYDNWQNLQLEIPNFNWEDISKLQISIQSLSPVDFTPTVYLDGLWLEVEYENLSSASIDLFGGSLLEKIFSGSSEEEPAGPEQNPETIGAVDSEIVPVLKIFDEKAKHKCVINPFSQQIIKGTSVNYDISLIPSGAGRPYEIILGDLPSGVEASFNQSLSGPSTPTTIPLTLTAGINAQSGSFNIAIIYRETQEDGEILANFCQLNLIIK